MGQVLLGRRAAEECVRHAPWFAKGYLRLANAATLQRDHAAATAALQQGLSLLRERAQHRTHRRLPPLPPSPPLSLSPSVSLPFLRPRALSPSRPLALSLSRSLALAPFPLTPPALFLAQAVAGAEGSGPAGGEKGGEAGT
jgi:hypothetical protein